MQGYVRRRGTTISLAFAALALAFSGMSAVAGGSATPGQRSNAELARELNAEILASRSATLTLEKWCREHRLSGGQEPKIVAQLLRGEPKPASAELRERLQVGPGEELKYRHVELRCGSRVLSEADNWYVPGRLSTDMNRLLDQTDTPFGKAIGSLQPYRRTRAVAVFWLALLPGVDAGTELGKDASTALPEVLFEHQALVFTKDGLPISEVRERYQRALLDPPANAE